MLDAGRAVIRRRDRTERQAVATADHVRPAHDLVAGGDDALDRGRRPIRRRRLAAGQQLGPRAGGQGHAPAAVALAPSRTGRARRRRADRWRSLVQHVLGAGRGRMADPDRSRPPAVLIGNPQRPRELPPQVDDPGQPVHRSTPQTEIALVGHRRATVPAHPERREVRQPTHRRGRLEGDPAELCVAVRMRVQAGPGGPHRPAARVAGTAVFGGSDGLPEPRPPARRPPRSHPPDRRTTPADGGDPPSTASTSSPAPVAEHRRRAAEREEEPGGASGGGRGGSTRRR